MGQRSRYDQGNTGKILGWCIIGLLMGIALLREKSDKADRLEQLRMNHRYAIATTMKYSYSRRIKYVDFYFYYNEKRYDSSFKWERGDRDTYDTLYALLFVKFCPADPSNNQVIRGHYIPDTIIAPRWGWKELPRFHR